MNKKVYTRKEVLGDGTPLTVEEILPGYQFLEGKILTIIEAALSDKNQLKAVKDLVKNEFSNQMMYVEQLCYPEVKMLTSDQAFNVVDTSKI